MTLAEFLQVENMKPSHLAGQLGVSVSTVTRILNAERTPSFGLMRKIARMTDGRVAPNDFVGSAGAASLDEDAK